MPKEVIARRLDTDKNPKSSLGVSWLVSAESVQVFVKINGTVAFAPSGIPSGEVATNPELFSPSLTRKEINDLIKALRRARDQVYGQDE